MRRLSLYVMWPVLVAASIAAASPAVAGTSLPEQSPAVVAVDAGAAGAWLEGTDMVTPAATASSSGAAFEFSSDPLLTAGVIASVGVFTGAALVHHRHDI